MDTIIITDKEPVSTILGSDRFVSTNCGATHDW